MWLRVLKKLAVLYQRIEERQNLINSRYQKFDREGSDLNSTLPLVEFSKNSKVIMFPNVTKVILKPY